MISKCQTKTTLKPTDSKYRNVFEEKTAYLNEERNIFDENLQYLSHDPSEFTALHNLKAKAYDLKAITSEFYENYQRFHSKKKKWTIIEHFKIAIPPEDRQVIIKNPSILLDLAVYWLKIYAPECLGYVKLHFDKNHPHAHILISGNLLGSSKQNRKSKKVFRKLQWELEQYKRQNYPELKQTNFYQKDYQTPARKKNAEQEMEQRPQGSQTSRKQEIRKILKTFFADPKITSKEQFVQALEKYSLKFYERGSISIGVVDTQTLKSGTQRKFRLNTLGVGGEWKEANKGWERTQDQLNKKSQKFQQRLSEIHSIRRSKARVFWKERGVTQAFQITYNRIKNPIISEGQRLVELKIIRQKRAEISFEQERSERNILDMNPTKQ